MNLQSNKGANMGGGMAAKKQQQQQQTLDWVKAEKRSEKRPNLEQTI